MFRNDEVALIEALFRFPIKGEKRLIALLSLYYQISFYFQFGYNAPSTITLDEQYVARNLFNCLNSILESTSYLFENETTLDHDDVLDGPNSQDPASTVPAFKRLDVSPNIDYQLIDEHNFENHFSLDYIKRAVNYFDEKDPLTGQRKRNWCIVKHMFRRIPNPQYVTRFRKYIEIGGTKKKNTTENAAPSTTILVALVTL
ncbi:unnamed protein product [Rotaria sordida]|uniref:Uncharacterized protein n=2 Tax=Rotaria sordida TaxID=392033 RepID=A0A819DRF6_9BILA|nr:unnamed protein product [Rotaria sordida]CAF3835155.1 unnamed protein product [Rotaria sordida]